MLVVDGHAEVITEILRERLIGVQVLLVLLTVYGRACRAEHRDLLRLPSRGGRRAQQRYRNDDDEKDLPTEALSDRGTRADICHVSAPLDKIRRTVGVLFPVLAPPRRILSERYACANVDIAVVQ